MCSTLLKILQSEWVRILHLAMHESSLCSTLLPILTIISLLICVNLLGMKYLIMILTFIFLITSKVYQHLTCLLANQFLLQISPCFYFVLCLFLMILQQLTYIANIFSQSETFFTVFGSQKL